MLSFQCMCWIELLAEKGGNLQESVIIFFVTVIQRYVAVAMSRTHTQGSRERSRARSRAHLTRAHRTLNCYMPYRLILHLINPSIRLPYCGLVHIDLFTPYRWIQDFLKGVRVLKRKQFGFREILRSFENPFGRSESFIRMKKGQHRALCWICACSQWHPDRKRCQNGSMFKLDQIFRNPFLNIEFLFTWKALKIRHFK